MSNSIGSLTKPGFGRGLPAACVLALIVAACLLAPWYAHSIAQTDPFRSNVNGVIRLQGQSVEVVEQNRAGLGLGATPIGPTWSRAYFLGADGQGRDVAARLLYGGRISLLIAGAAGALCLAVAACLGILAGSADGIADAVLAWLLDLLWAFPVMLLAMSLSAVLLSQTIRLGPMRLGADSLALPIVILGVVFVPYLARPIRAQVKALRRTEFVIAAVALGGGYGHIVRRHVLPRVGLMLLVFAPMILGMILLTEAALSVLSIGVQAPAASWGTLLADGQDLIYARPLVAIAPGVAIIVTVLALNTLSEALRERLDPGLRLRGG